MSSEQVKIRIIFTKVNSNRELKEAEVKLCAAQHHLGEKSCNCLGHVKGRDSFVSEQGLTSNRMRNLENIIPI